MLSWLQALVATYVGRRDLENARRVLMRVTQIALLVGVILVGTFWAPRDALPFAFTSDLAVAEQVRFCHFHPGWVIKIICWLKQASSVMVIAVILSASYSPNSFSR
jgi:Na+-driven multidrug efflux pump